MGAFLDFLELWDILEGMRLHMREFRISIYGGSLSLGSTQPNLRMMHYSRGQPDLLCMSAFGNHGPLLNAIFFMWLVAHNPCWTADRLARRGLPHPDKCPLCDQEYECIEHLLIGCVFSRQFWFDILDRFGLANLTPQ